MTTLSSAAKSSKALAKTWPYPQQQQYADLLRRFDAISKASFHALLAQKPAIEHELGAELKWVETPGRKSRYIALYLTNTDPADRAGWLDQHRWMLTQLDAFRRCFSPRVKRLGSGETAPPDNTMEPGA